MQWRRVVAAAVLLAATLVAHAHALNITVNGVAYPALASMHAGDAAAFRPVAPAPLVDAFAFVARVLNMSAPAARALTCFSFGLPPLLAMRLPPLANKALLVPMRTADGSSSWCTRWAQRQNATLVVFWLPYAAKNTSTPQEAAAYLPASDRDYCRTCTVPSAFVARSVGLQLAGALRANATLRAGFGGADAYELDEIRAYARSLLAVEWVPLGVFVLTGLAAALHLVLVVVTRPHWLLDPRYEHWKDDAAWHERVAVSFWGDAAALCVLVASVLLAVFSGQLGACTQETSPGAFLYLSLGASFLLQATLFFACFWLHISKKLKAVRLSSHALGGTIWALIALSAVNWFLMGLRQGLVGPAGATANTVKNSYTLALIIVIAFTMLSSGVLSVVRVWRVQAAAKDISSDEHVRKGKIVKIFLALTVTLYGVFYAGAFVTAVFTLFPQHTLDFAPATGIPQLDAQTSRREFAVAHLAFSLLVGCMFATLLMCVDHTRAAAARDGALSSSQSPKSTASTSPQRSPQATTSAARSEASGTPGRSARSDA